MAAQQAAEVSEIPTVVVPTKSITQGISTLLMFNPDQTIEANQQAMSEYAQTVDYGQITNAIRDTQIDAIQIKKDDYMGILNGDIVLAHADLAQALEELVEQMVDEDSELVTVIVGEDGDEATVEAVEDQVLARYPDLEFEVIQGDQPVYHYFVSVD